MEGVSIVDDESNIEPLLAAASRILVGEDLLVQELEQASRGHAEEEPSRRGRVSVGTPYRRSIALMRAIRLPSPTMRVIGTVGLPGSGKGEFATVARDRGIPVVTMGDVVRDACRERGLAPADHHGQVASALREEDGPLAIAERTVPPVREALEDHDVVLIDGLRSGAEAGYFEEVFDDAWTLVAIEAPFDRRVERIDARGRDNTATETLKQRDQREVGFGMGDAIDRADVRIRNTGALATFHRQVERILTDAQAGEDPASSCESDTRRTEGETTDADEFDATQTDNGHTPDGGDRP